MIKSKCVEMLFYVYRIEIYLRVMSLPSLQCKCVPSSPCTFRRVAIFKMDTPCAYYQLAMKLDGVMHKVETVVVVDFRITHFLRLMEISDMQQFVISHNFAFLQ